MAGPTQAHPDERTDDNQTTSGEQEEEPSFDLDLPEDSILTREEYLEMYKTASSEAAFAILVVLDEYKELSTGELSAALGREDNDLHYYLRKLKESGLIRNRQDPNTGTEEPYSYYTLSNMGSFILNNGLKEGIEKLAAEEKDINEGYSG